MVVDQERQDCNNRSGRRDGKAVVFALLFMIIVILLAAGVIWRIALSGGYSRTPSFSEGQVYDAGGLVGSVPRLVSHVFEFRNETKVPISVSEAHPSCSCTEYQIDPEVVGPGEIGTIELTTELRGSGPSGTNVEVFWSDGRQSNFRLRATAQIPRELLATPRLITLEPGESSKILLTFLNIDEGEPVVPAVEGSDSFGMVVEEWTLLTAGDPLNHIASRWVANAVLTLGADFAGKAEVEISMPDAKPIRVQVRTNAVVGEARRKIRKGTKAGAGGR